MARSSSLVVASWLFISGLACQVVPVELGESDDEPPPDQDSFGTASPPQGGDEGADAWGEDGGEESTDAGEEEPDEGGGFIQVGDGGPPPMCDPMLDDDCGDGWRCVAYSLEPGLNVPDAYKCIPTVTKPKQVGEACVYEDWQSGWDDCDAGLVCWDRMDGQGVCLEICDSEGACEAEGTTCNANKTLPLCFWPCDPMGDDCPPTCACYGESPAPTCYPRGELAQGEPCGYINDCASGLQCIDGEYLVGCEGDACCTKWCSVAQGGCEGPDIECVPYYDQPLDEAQEDYGVCVTTP